jgi:hypothetical protein
MATIGRSLGVVSELTIISKVLPGHRDALHGELERHQPTVSQLFGRIPTVHFVQFTILTPGGPQAGAYLQWTTIYDGTLEPYQAALVEHLRYELDAIWSHCEGWPGATTKEGLREFVARYAVTADLLYASYPDATVGQVRQALAVDGEVEHLLDLLAAPGGRSPEQVDAALDKVVQLLQG